MPQHRIITSAPRPSRKGAAILAWLTAIARQHVHVATLFFDPFVNEQGEFAPNAVSQKACPCSTTSIQSQ